MAKSTHEPCRRCGAMLKRFDHYRPVRHERVTRTVYDERLEHERTESELRLVYRHTPCPQCGDPEPMNSWRRKLPGVLVLIGFAVIAAGMIWLIAY